jgi:D-threo-aldose 1-dehydrogenase
LPLCEERGIDVIAAGVFNSGVLAGGSTFDYRTASPEIVERVDWLRETCARYGAARRRRSAVPVATLAVKTIVVGCRTPAEVEEDLRLSVLDIPETLWEEIE